MTCKMSIVRCRIHRAPVILETVQLLSVGPASESITLENDELARTQAHLQAEGIANERTPSER